MTIQVAPIAELTAITEAILRAKSAFPDAWKALADLESWEIYTDGSAPIKNPGGAIGFSSVFLLGDGTAWEVFGGTVGRTAEPATSNNRAEIAGALAILETIYLLKQDKQSLPSVVEIVCDSQYVVNCAQGKWKKHKNKDLWRRFDQLLSVTRQEKIKLNFRWTRAHVGTQWNERADVLAKDGAFLAIGKTATDEFPQMEEKISAAPRVQAAYSIQLFSEMSGKTTAKGSYKLATPLRNRTDTVNLSDIITLDEAEYQLLILALKDLLSTLGEAKKEAGDFAIEVDSSRDLMLKQLQGLYGVKSERLQPLHKKASALVRQFSRVEWLKSSKKELQEALKSW